MGQVTDLANIHFPFHLPPASPVEILGTLRKQWHLSQKVYSLPPLPPQVVWDACVHSLVCTLIGDFEMLLRYYITSSFVFRKL